MILLTTSLPPLSLLSVLGVIALLILSAFFSGMEIAYLTSDRLRVEVDLSKGGVVSKALKMLFRNPDRYVTTVLVGNNIVLVMYGLLMSLILDPYLEQFIHSGWLLVLVDSLISTLVIIVFGEYLPKSQFKRNPNSAMRHFSLLSAFFYFLLLPITLFCSVLSRGFLRLMGVRGNQAVVHRHLTTIDLDHYLSDTLLHDDDQGTLNTEVKIIQNAIGFSDVRARDCMVPRSEVVACDLATPLETLRGIFVSTGLSKIIVYDGSIDNVVGYIHSSEMFRGDDWQERMKQALFVPESVFGHKLMKQLMQRKQSVAIVVDELGGMAGIVTMEDLVEEIFGDIEDEHDKKQLVIRQIDDSNYIFSARCEIDLINEEYHLNLPESDEYNTLAGLILAHHGDIPKTREIVEIGKLRFTILRSSSTRIELVKLTLLD